MRAAADRIIWQRRAMRVIGGVIRIGEAAALALWPSSVAPGVPTPDEIRQMERAARAQEAERLQEITVNRQRLISPDELLRMEVTAQRIPAPAPRAIPSASSPPAPSSRPGPAAPGAGRPRGMLGRLPWAQILIGAVIGELAGRSSSSASSSFAPSTSETPLTRSQPDALPSGEPPQIIVTGGGTTRCECPPKRQRKQRNKCLEWAQIEWRSGRYKGKPAGRKCVRRER